MSINKAGQEQRQAMRHNRQARASVRQRIASNLTRETSKCQDKPNGQPIRKRSVSGAEDDPLKIDMVVADDVISMKERVSCNLIYSKMEPSRPKKRNRKSPSEPWRSENAQKTSLQPSTSRLKNTGRSTTLERSLWSLKILWKHVLDRQTSSQQFIWIGWTVWFAILSEEEFCLTGLFIGFLTWIPSTAYCPNIIITKVIYYHSYK